MSRSAPESIDILHVDDEPDFAELAASFLEREDDRFDVMTATSASDGLDALAATDVDCIVSDYDMPRTDGLDFLESVREDYPELPFILFTGKGSEEIASEAVSAGVTDYLQKDSSYDQYAVLANRIENAVSQYHAEQALDATRERYETLISRSTDIILIYRQTGDLQYVSSAVERILGHPAHELVGGTALEYIHQDDRATVRDAFERVREQPDDAVRTEYRVRTADDEWVWIESRLRNMLDDDTIGGIVEYARDVSDRVETREQLEEERDRRETLFKNPSDSIVEIEFHDETPVVQSTNETFRTVFGYDPAEVVGEPVSEVLVPDETETADRHDEIAQRVLDGEVVDTEVRRQTRDGPREFLLRVFPIDVAGAERGSYAIYTDITERKRHEQTLEALHDVATDITAFDTVAGICERTVEAAEAVLDLEMCGIALHEDGWLEPVAVSDGSLEDAFRRMEADQGVAGRTFQTGESVRLSDIHADPDSDARDDTYRSGLSVPIGDRGIFQAVSEAPDAFDEADLEAVEVLLAHTETGLDRLERERDLQEYETIVEASGDPVYTLDADGNFTFVNDRLAEISGYDKSTLIGTHVDLVMDQADIERAQDLIRHLLSSDEELATFEMDLIAADGERRQCEGHISLIPSEDGFEGTVGVIRDITERKTREEQLARQNDRLDEFASIVSHDIRNPLSVASGAAELAQADCDSEHLETVLEAHERMDSLIEDLLSLARAGDSLTEVTPVELDEAVRECWRHVPTEAATLEVETDRTIAADPSRLQQLLENLVRNAIDHGGESVTVTLGELDDGFYLADDGPGIPEADRSVVFDGGYSTADGGNGWGLSIVADVVQAHGWTISVTDSAAGGARFEIRDVD